MNFCGFWVSLVIVLFSSTSANALRVGYFTGTFDPPHASHVDTVARAIEHGRLDIVYIEATLAEHKPNALPYEERIKMMGYAFRDVPEVRRVPDSVLRHVLKDANIAAFKELLGIHKNDEFFRILGSDKFTSETVLRMEGTGLQYVVNVREALDLEAPYAQTVLKRKGTVILPPALFQTSSTDIRMEAKRGRRHEHLDPEIYKRVVSLGGYMFPICKSLL
ncbi:MAG: adenylyltransferase/cytidyltransferase family protein [Bdellovibrionales bacterium]